MDPEGSTEPRGKGGALSVWGLVFLVIAYLLSPGPVVAFYKRRPSGNVPQVVRSLYFPLAYASENLKPVEVFYDWYLSLWIKSQPIQKP